MTFYTLYITNDLNGFTKLTTRQTPDDAILAFHSWCDFFSSCPLRGMAIVTHDQLDAINSGGELVYYRDLSPDKVNQIKKLTNG